MLRARLVTATVLVAIGVTALGGPGTLLGRVAAAAPCPPIVGGSDDLLRHDVEARIHFVQASLARSAVKARAWTAVWTLFHAAFAIQGAVRLGLASSGREQATLSIELFGSALGIVSTVARPIKVMGDESRFRRELARTTPSDEPSIRCAVLALGERLFERDAADQARGAGRFAHTGNFGYNAAVGAVLSGVVHDWQAATIDPLVGIVVGELMIFSRPRDLPGLLERYRRGDLGPTR